MTSTSKLQKVGDKWVLELDPAIVEEMGIAADTPVNLSTSEGVLKVSPVRYATAAEVEAAMRQSKRRMGEAYRKLAE